MIDFSDLKSKTIFITGAFGLFGKQLIHCFYNVGSQLVLCGHSKNAIKKWLSQESGKYDKERFVVVPLELTDSKSIQQSVNKAVERFGGIDVLINNAAIDAKFDSSEKNELDPSRFEHYPIDKIEKSVQVNVLGTVEMTQAVCRQMVKQKNGNIINVGSIYSVIAPNPELYSGVAGVPAFKPPDYVISKSFVPNFTRYIAAHYAGENIRCNALAPHGVYNNHDEQFVENFSKLSPMGRMCDSGELEGPFLFLASEASGYLNGTTLVLDGGWSIW